MNSISNKNRCGGDVTCHRSAARTTAATATATAISASQQKNDDEIENTLLEEYCGVGLNIVTSAHTKSIIE